MTLQRISLKQNPDKGQEARNVSPEFILIYIFPQLVINQFGYECGYGNSALRNMLCPP